jgi:hypothetical protein
MLMTTGKDMEYFNGKMENNTKEIGKMANNMEREFSLIKNKEKLKVNGLKVKELGMK